MSRHSNVAEIDQAAIPHIDGFGADHRVQQPEGAGLLQL